MFLQELTIRLHQGTTALRHQVILATLLPVINHLDILRRTILPPMDHRLLAAPTERLQVRVHLLGKGSSPCHHLEKIHIGIPGIPTEIHTDLQIRMLILLGKVETPMQATIATGSTRDTVDRRKHGTPMRTFQVTMLHLQRILKVMHLRQAHTRPTLRILGMTRGTSPIDRKDFQAGKIQNS